LEKLDQGFTWDFIVRDSGIAEESMMRKMFQGKKGWKVIA
jgi:hypothetical protein